MPTSYRDPHTRVLTRVAAFEQPGCYQPTFHYDCPENQLRSLVGRVAGVVPHPTKPGLELLYRARNLLSRDLPTNVANPLEDMPERYSGAKRDRYRRALADLYHFGLTKSHAVIKFFVKTERFDPNAKVEPDPRAIQFRGPRFAVALGAFLHAIEGSLYTISSASSGVPPTRNIAKGLNSVQRATLVNEKMSYFRNPVVVSLDASRFDKHVTQPLLRLEHSVYLHCIKDPYFATLLSWQLVNKGISNLGLKYTLSGRRMSGDMNTAVGNCVLMILMLIAFSLSIGLRKWDCVDDGDDCLYIFEADQLPLVLSHIKPVFLSFGMEMKIDHVAHCPSQVLFCRSKMIEYQPGKWKFVRDYRDVLSKSLTGTKHWESQKYRRRVINSIGLCELILGLGVPVLQEFAVMMLRNVGTTDYDLSLAPAGLAARAARDLKLLGGTASRVTPGPVLDCARESFETAFGLSICDQLSLEATLRKTAIKIDGGTYPVDELHPNWSWIQTVHEMVSV